MALFHMETRVCLKYFLNDCSQGNLVLFQYLNRHVLIGGKIEELYLKYMGIQNVIRQCFSIYGLYAGI